MIDSYVAVTLTPKASLGLDVNYVTNEVNQADPELSLQGIGAYARYQLSSPRRCRCATSGSTTKACSEASSRCCRRSRSPCEHKFADGFLLRGEFRRDWSNEQFFTRQSPATLRRHQNTALVGLVWWFGNKTGAW